MNLVPIHIRLLEEQYQWLRQYCFDQRVSQAEVIREALELYRKEKEEEEMVLSHEKTTYDDGRWEYPAVFVRWGDVEEYLGGPHTGDWEQDKRLVEGLLAAGAPAWVEDAPGWTDEEGWGLYDTENPIE